MRVLLIDDDPVFAATLARALGRRGIETALAHTADSALETAAHWQPSHVLLDLNLGGDISGLDLIAPLCERVAGVQITVLTGYASIATTVTAMQRGAAGYLAKPVDAPTVLAALAGDSEATSHAMPGERMSLKRLEWEHIQRVLAEHDGNISEAARALGLHRRTLQRKLDKKPVKF
ncbi:response regulator [uncultured Salinisphaera sp.]|uniref:response regulator transcription factor n=1 Tax=uncultured Salinisphaera sp. TaxID=359372 RepID=UPI0032B1F051|tara:strand:+ start:1007 stop:1534 length:528 start_codon:yes stop_codon:yes gene_type:complete